MRKTYPIILFFLFLTTELLLIWTGYDQYRYFTKPLLVPLLILYFVTNLGGEKSPLKKWIIMALLFSWIGDVLLMFEQRDPIFFILGLASFLVAHIFYIIFFSTIKILNGIKTCYLILVLAIAYYISMMMLLRPSGLDELGWPVRIYGAVILFMLFYAMHMIYIGKVAGNNMIAGAVLFVVSDSLLAINKFYYSLSYAGVVIMLTYALAQFFIVRGAINYIRRPNSKEQ